MVMITQPTEDRLVVLTTVVMVLTEILAMGFEGVTTGSLSV